MKKITTTQEISVVAVLVFVLSVVGYVFLYKHIDDLRVKLSEAKTEIAKVEKSEENNLAVALLLDETKQEREELSKYFVPSDDPTLFFELIESIAKDSGVITEIQITSAPSGEETQKQEGTLLVEGGWKNIFHFITLVELMPYVVTVNQVAFSVEEKDKNSFWKGQIQIEYYVK